VSKSKDSDGCGCVAAMFGLPFLALSLVISGFSLFGQVRSDPRIATCGTLAHWFVGGQTYSAACTHGMHVRLFEFFCATPVGLALILAVLVALFGGALGAGPDAVGTIRSGGHTWSWKLWWR
jgi:hypothetical protein